MGEVKAACQETLRAFDGEGMKQVEAVRGDSDVDEGAEGENALDGRVWREADIGKDCGGTDGGKEEVVVVARETIQEPGGARKQANESSKHAKEGPGWRFEHDPSGGHPEAEEAEELQMGGAEAVAVQKEGQGESD